MEPFGITILVIVATTLAASYIRRITKDKCIHSFEGDTITIEMADGTEHEGKLEVESTGLEVIFAAPRHEGDILKMSHILYKDEYPLLQSIVRYHGALTEKGRHRRELALQRTYHPNTLRRLKRRIQNVMKLIKDSLMEIANAFSGKLKATATTALVAENEKYANKLNQELVNTIDASYDQLLEKYIGNVVFFSLKKGETTTYHKGILKEYTQQYLELMETSYMHGQACDAIFPRRICHVRGLGEDGRKYEIFSRDFDIRAYRNFFRKTNAKKKPK